MKKLISVFLALVFAAGLMPFNVCAAGESVLSSWFGSEENDYTEGFEEQTEWSLPASFQGSSQVGNIEGRRITGEKYLAVERPSTGDPAVSYADKSDNAISEGTACISFGVRVRKASTDFSISFAETGAVLDGLDHISDNVFQVRNNGANFDLYIDETRVCALTTGGNIGSGDMSDIVRISAAIDFDRQLLRVRADRINSDGITVETKTTDTQLDAEIADGTSVTAELVWSEQSVPEYDMTKADTYTFTAKAKGLQVYISNAAEFEFEQNVIVEIPEDRTIAGVEEIADAQYNVSNNIATVDQIAEKLQKTVEITLDDESVYKADVIWTCVNADNSAEA